MTMRWSSGNAADSENPRQRRDHYDAADPSEHAEGSSRNLSAGQSMVDGPTARSGRPPHIRSRLEHPTASM